MARKHLSLEADLIWKISLKFIHFFCLPRSQVQWDHFLLAPVGPRNSPSDRVRLRPWAVWAFPALQHGRRGLGVAPRPGQGGHWPSLLRGETCIAPITELRRTLILSYAAPWDTELPRTLLLSYTAPFTKLRRTLFFWATPHSLLLSYTAPNNELRRTQPLLRSIFSTAMESEVFGTL